MRPDYVCGFLFSPDKEYVVLIRKQKPLWQAGSLNGVGGKIEEGETPMEAMRREFKEETGVDVLYWKEFATLGSGQDWRVHFFTADHPWYSSVRTQESEEIEIHKVADIPRQVMIPNLRWLIPQALGNQAPWPYIIEEHNATT